MIEHWKWIEDLHTKVNALDGLVVVLIWFPQWEGAWGKWPHKRQAISKANAKGTTDNMLMSAELQFNGKTTWIVVDLGAAHYFVDVLETKRLGLALENDVG